MEREGNMSTQKPNLNIWLKLGELLKRFFTYGTGSGNYSGDYTKDEIRKAQIRVNKIRADVRYRMELSKSDPDSWRKSDADAIASDWIAVGDYLRGAMQQFEEEQDIK